MRLFVALALPTEAATELDEVVAPLRPAWPDLRWTGRDAWHLTLAFLGEVEESVTTELAVRLERAARRHPCLSLSLAGAGAFPGASRARVLWTGIQGDRRGLGLLAASAGAGAQRAGARPANSGRLPAAPHPGQVPCAGRRELARRNPRRVRRDAMGGQGNPPHPQQADRESALRGHRHLAAARCPRLLM